MAGGFRVREQKFICGKDYATAETMQVDFFEITEQQHKASTRKKKELASSIAKEAYNLRQSGRYLELLIQRNFRRTDYSVTYTYDCLHPATWSVWIRIFPPQCKSCTVCATRPGSNIRAGSTLRSI